MKRSFEEFSEPTGASTGGATTNTPISSIVFPSTSSVVGGNQFLTLKNDSNAPILLANEVRNAKVDTESEVIVDQRAKYIKEKLDNMTEEQLTRFEFFIRSHLPKARVKEIMNEALGPKQLVTDEMVIVVSGLAKIFVGEVCDLAAQVMKERGGSGILPDHIQEAYRRMQNDGTLGVRADNYYFLNSDTRFSTRDSLFDFDYSEDISSTENSR